MAKKTQDNKAWDEFVAWCQERGVSAVPANPWTVAAYARWCEPRFSYADLAKAFKTIFRVHNAKSRRRPDRDPLVKTTLAQIEGRAKKKKERAKDKRKPLFPDDDILKPKKPKAPKKAKKTTKAGKTKKAAKPKAQSKAQSRAKSKTRSKTKDKAKGKARSRSKSKEKNKAGAKKKTRRSLSSTPKLVSKRKLKK